MEERRHKTTSFQKISLYFFFDEQMPITKKGQGGSLLFLIPNWRLLFLIKYFSVFDYA
jgi:hypothetical protein